MFIETYGGTCPNCAHSPLVQRYDTGIGCNYQLDACPNCGFGYGHVQGEDDKRGEFAWEGWFGHLHLMMEGKHFQGTNTELRRYVYNLTKNETPDPSAPTTVFQYVAVPVADCVPDDAPVFSTESL